MSDSPITVLFIDADNTLWDTDGVYERAQLGLLTHLEDHLAIRFQEHDRLAFVRSIDQGLAERHHAGLRYPPRFLVKALALALAGCEKTDAVRLAWSGGREADRLPADVLHQIESQMIEDLERTPSLRPGVLSGLSRLYGQKFPKVVLTESKQERVWRVVEAHGLERLIERVVEIRKEPQSYKRLIQVFRPSRSGIMVGDQLERDVRPAKAAGLLTIYFPSRFRPKWELRHQEVSSDYQIESFDQVPPIIESFLSASR